MPRRPELRSICLIGSGPIVIGQACEFDYSGSQALKVLREEGLQTIVVTKKQRGQLKKQRRTWD